MEKPFIEINGDIFIAPFDANPISGHQFPKDFPNCCSRHERIFRETQEWFTKFPNCCDPHKAMAKKYWFDWWIKQNDYSGIAKKIVRQISYTEYLISEKIKEENWYKCITDYIDYNVSSLGQPAIGLHIYLGAVKHYVANTSEVPEEIKRKSIIGFVEHFYNPPKESEQKIDLNLLYKTYQDWVKAFPFELNSYFGHLKQQYERQLPIIDGTPDVNIYSGVAKVKVVTKEKLFRVLIDLTSNLLKQFNGLALYELGMLTDTNRIKLELIVAERKRKIEQGYKYNSPDETTQYKKMIQYWLNDEKKFIVEIAPLIASPTTPSSKKKESLSINQIALIHAYNGSQIMRTNSDRIAKQYGHNSGEKLFQRFTYYNSRANRKGIELTDKKTQNKIELIESVIQHLNEQGKELARDEIQIFKQH